MKYKILALLLTLSSHLFLRGQDTKTSNEHKIGMIVSSGFSFGIQSVSIPPLQTKCSVGFNYTVNHNSFYLLPGLTLGIAPSISLHIESGFKFHFLTLDYSYNKSSFRDENGDGINLRNHCLNLGLQFKIYTKEKTNVWIWIKGGKTFEEAGYSDEFPAIWNGHNLELKFIYERYKIIK